MSRRRRHRSEYPSEKVSKIAISLQDGVAPGSSGSDEEHVLQMSASTPPSINDEVRIELPDEAYIPLPSSVASSQYGEDDTFDAEELGSVGAELNGAMQGNGGGSDQEAGMTIDLPTAGEQEGPIHDTPEDFPQGDNLKKPTEEVPVPLAELLKVMEEDKYQSRRLMTLQDEAYGLFHKCGSYDRFLTVQLHLYRRMVECFRSDKKNAFASMYAKAMSYPSFADLEVPAFGLDDRHPVLGSSRNGKSDVSWISRLPAESQRGLVEFLVNIRTSSGYLAERVCRLPESQLKRLARPHYHNGPVEPNVQSTRGYGRYDPRAFQRSMAKPSEQAPSVDELMGDPLMLLINGFFDPSNRPGSPERVRQLRVWSSVCCGLIEHSKPGSDDFCITVLDAFAKMSKWPLGPQLELYLAETIALGGPLLAGSGGRNTSSPQPIHSQHTDHGSSVSSFFDHALYSLLDLLINDLNNSVPGRALEMIQSVLHNIKNQERRITARNFFFLRWYCASFLYNAVVFPETHGIMMEQSLSNNDRQSILRELIVRLQKVVTDVLSPWSSNPVAPALESKIRTLLEVFERERSTIPEPESDMEHLRYRDRLFLFLRPEDVLAVAKVLSPEAYSDSSSNSIFERPSSRSSSVFGLPSFSSGPILGSVGDPQYPQAYSGKNVMQSNTWHAQSFGGRPGIADIGYTAFERSHMARPGSSGGFLADIEKDNSLPFTHDLWLLTANREYSGPGPTKKHEAAVLFINDEEPYLSLNPFRDQDHISTVALENNQHFPKSVQGMHYGDSILLAAALARIAENHHGLVEPFSRPSEGMTGLRTAFRQNLRVSESEFDFQSKYFWWNCLETLEALSPATVSCFLSLVFRQRLASVHSKRALSDQYEEWLYILRQRSTIQDQVMQRISLSSKRLRNKMWYVSDVRHSSAYEDAYNVTRALKAMIEPAEQRANGMAAWAKQRIRNSFGHERALSQTLELMTAPKTYGGPNKLSESQVQITTDWLLTENVENFCKGEERIHRFCYEIQKCVKRLAGEAMLDSPVLWASPLYQSEKAEHGIAAHHGQRHSQEQLSWRTDFSYPQGWNPSTLAGSGTTFAFPDAESPSTLHMGVSNISSSPQNAGASPQSQSRSFVPRNWALPPSPISPGNVKTSGEGSSLRRRAFLQNLRSHLTSLLLSDLGSVLWARGSETDQWVTGTGIASRPSTQSRNCFDESTGSTLDPMAFSSGSFGAVGNRGSDYLNEAGRRDSFDVQMGHEQPPKPFQFQDTFKTLLKRFQLSPDPQSKLQYLYELFLLASYNCQADQYQSSLRRGDAQKNDDKTKGDTTATVLGLGVPRTRLTRLQEVAANCEDRRLGSLANTRLAATARIFQSTALPAPHLDDPALIELIHTLFADPRFRPSAFFRDLQFIASLTPSSTLDYTPQGTAFWTIGLAAMSVKSAKCKAMTDNAMQILEFHYGNGNQKEPSRTIRGSQGPTATPSSALSQEDLSGSTLQDAARLLTTSALEGDPTAARELALFHLTHPELVSRVTLPLSRPSDVFQVKHGGSSERGHRSTGSEDPGGLDPITFAVVFHWMEFAANAGDADAITFFKENEGLGKAL